MSLITVLGATLIDGTGAPPRASMSVLVEGDRIAWVLPDREVAPGVSGGGYHRSMTPPAQRMPALLRRSIAGLFRGAPDLRCIRRAGGTGDRRR